MKTQVLMALLGTSASLKVRDAPAYFNEPTWRQTWPSASGLVQIEDNIEGGSVCHSSNQQGVTCQPDGKFFANGMVGSEDIHQDIDMKGVYYHYGQKEGQNNFANTMHGNEDLKHDITMKRKDYRFGQQGTNQEFAYGNTGFEHLKQDIVINEKTGQAPYQYSQVEEQECPCKNSGLCEVCKAKQNGECPCKNSGLCEVCKAKESEECPCKNSGLCEVCQAKQQSLAQDGYTDNMGYSGFKHPYYPGTTTPNFNIKQGGKCLEWDRDGNQGNDQHQIRFVACNDNNHQQWFNFHQMSRTIRAYSRQNFVISPVAGHFWNGETYQAVIRPWEKNNYQVIDYSADAKCTFMNTDGPNGFALTNVAGDLQWTPCTGAASQKFSISAFAPG